MPTTDAVVVHSDGIQPHLAYGVSTFFINGKPVFGNGLRGIPRNPPTKTIESLITLH